MKSFHIKFIAFYFIGIGIMIAGVVLSFVSFINTASNADNATNRFLVPGVTEVSLEEDGKYQIYLETSTVYDGKVYTTDKSNISGLVLEVTNADTGEQIDLETSFANLNYTINGRSGTSFMQFSVDEPMTILVRAQYEDEDGPEVVLNIEKSAFNSVAKGIVLSVVSLLGGIFIGLIVIIVTVIMHVRANKKYRQTQRY